MISSPSNKNNLIETDFTIGIIAGKGGVGKSTITCQLAKSLNRLGHRIGVFDGDVYGPSMRHLLPETIPPKTQGSKVLPADSEGIAVMSTAFFPKGKGPSVVRAPIANQIINQFISEVEWGKLDALLVDFPPGTGDVQISLMQKLFFNGVIVVTTPQEISLLDVRKSMKMCVQMGVPILGVVENMSYFSAQGSKERHLIFGEGGGKKLAKEFDIPLLEEIPVDPSIAAQKKLQSEPIFDAFSKNVFSLLKEEKEYKIKQEDRYHFSIRWLDGKKSLYRFEDVLRYCPCIECLEKDKPLINVEGEKIVRVGNYGIQILFSKGCSKGIYPFSMLRDLDR
ncbi:MAG: P-loop NTPase [Simkaniaceae bacterium]|nr:P-loop NTPase [Simkaniaceae bacterium]